MTDRYALRTDVDLATEITAFLADSSLGGDEITGMIDLLGEVGEVAIFGGMPRDIARGGADAFDSDVDLVVDGRAEDLDIALIGLGAVRNKYGGYRLRVARHRFDVWTLSSTWAVRERLVTVKSLADLVRTTFFDCDAVIYRCSERAVYLSDGFARWLRHGIVDINLVENPNPLGMAARAQRIVHEWKEKLGPNLTAYVSAVPKGLSRGLVGGTGGPALTSRCEGGAAAIGKSRRPSQILEKASKGEVVRPLVFREALYACHHCQSTEYRSFLLKYLLPSEVAKKIDAPIYAGEACRHAQAGEDFDLGAAISCRPNVSCGQRNAGADVDG